MTYKDLSFYIDKTFNMNGASKEHFHKFLKSKYIKFIIHSLVEEYGSVNNEHKYELLFLYRRFINNIISYPHTFFYLKSNVMEKISLLLAEDICDYLKNVKKLSIDKRIIREKIYLKELIPELIFRYGLCESDILEIQNNFIYKF